VNEITSAATAALIASEAGIGRSRAPPSPCIGTTITSSDLELGDQGVADVLLHLDHAGCLEGELLGRRALVERDLLLGEECTCSSPERSDVIVTVSGSSLFTGIRLLVGMIVSPLMETSSFCADASVDGSLLVVCWCRWCRCRSR
jgi:hypothetical protein